MNKKEKAELEEKYQLLLFYNTQITKICMIHTGMITGIDYNNLDERMGVDLFLKFNIHAFTAYFDKYFYTKYKVKPENQIEFLTGWNDNMKKIINPLYQQELKKLRGELAKKSISQNYIS